MIGTLPMHQLAPLEYRIALDSAMPMLLGRRVLLRCASQKLLAEVRQRAPLVVSVNAEVGLWVEPQTAMLADDLAQIAMLPVNARLVVIVSRPLGQMLPQRRDVAAKSIGLTADGRRLLRRTLGLLGFAIERTVGIHSLDAIVLGQFSRLADSLNRPDLGDRLRAVARLRFSDSTMPQNLATLHMMLACRQKVVL